MNACVDGVGTPRSRGSVPEFQALVPDFWGSMPLLWGSMPEVWGCDPGAQGFIPVFVGLNTTHARFSAESAGAGLPLVAYAHLRRVRGIAVRVPGAFVRMA